VTRAARTLRLRVEFVRQLRRRRTQFAAGVLVLLPVAVALAFRFGSGPSGGGSADREGSALVGLATTGGLNFALFCEFASVGFLLIVIVALFCGDTVASEANWSSLRYLLTVPVPRARLLRQKLIVALTLSLGANLLLPAWALAVGTMFFGTAPVRSPLFATFGYGESLARLALVVAFVCGQLLFVAGLAFLVSVCVDSPLGAVGGAVVFVIVSNILDSITALGGVRRYLPTHFQFSWLDALAANVVWGDLIRGTGLSLVYAAVFAAGAWLYFDRKDITS
jgi:ABC-2 type transport system permease protein